MRAASEVEDDQRRGRFQGKKGFHRERKTNGH